MKIRIDWVVGLNPVILRISLKIVYLDLYPISHNIKTQFVELTKESWEKERGTQVSMQYPFNQRYISPLLSSPYWKPNYEEYVEGKVTGVRSP